MHGHFSIVCVAHGDLSAARVAQVDAIFFGAAARSFPPGAEREAFRERWLGRYLRGSTDALFVALDGPDTDSQDTVAGYLVGAVENPSLQDRFADIGYFRTDFLKLCRQYPAHLHINLAPQFRSYGVGAQLIEAFAQYAAGHGARGMHVVTGRGMRNMRFYDRCGFSERGSTLWNGKEIVFLGRAFA